MEHTANQATEQKITTNKPPLHEEKPVIQELFSCDNFEEKIHGMISDPSFIELRRNSLDLSLFDVVGMTHTERWHSAFLAWLLNPSERSSHGLAYFPMKQLLSTMRKKPEKNWKENENYLHKIANRTQTKNQNSKNATVLSLLKILLIRDGLTIARSCLIAILIIMQKKKHSSIIQETTT